MIESASAIKGRKDSPFSELTESGIDLGQLCARSLQTFLATERLSVQFVLDRPVNAGRNRFGSPFELRQYVAPLAAQFAGPIWKEAPIEILLDPLEVHALDFDRAEAAAVLQPHLLPAPGVARKDAHCAQSILEFELGTTAHASVRQLGDQCSGADFQERCTLGAEALAGHEVEPLVAAAGKGLSPVVNEGSPGGE